MKKKKLILRRKSNYNKLLKRYVILNIRVKQKLIASLSTEKIEVVYVMLKKLLYVIYEAHISVVLNRRIQMSEEILNIEI